MSAWEYDAPTTVLEVYFGGDCGRGAAGRLRQNGDADLLLQIRHGFTNKLGV
jgi:hypothetical protein